MLHLLRKGLEPNTPFRRIVYGCAAAHLFFFFGACFIACDDELHLAIRPATDVRIICVPSFMMPPTTQKKITRTQRSQKSVRRKKKITQKKKTVMQSLRTKKAVKKIVPIKKPLPEPEVEEVEESIETPQEIVQKQNEQTINSPEVEQEILYVTSSTYQELELTQELHKAIGAHWSPPVGMPDGLQCKIRVKVTSDGMVQSLEVVEKSGVAVFDMAARQALQAAEFPRAVYGKTIVIHFNEESV